MFRSLFLPVLLLILTAAAPTLAADGAATTVPVTDILTALVALGGGVALAVIRPVAAAACVWFETHTRIRLDESQRALLDSLCYRGIEFAMGDLDQRITASRPGLNVHNTTIASAADYVLAHAPEAAAHFGLDRDAIIRMITARFTVAAAPPANGEPGPAIVPAT